MEQATLSFESMSLSHGKQPDKALPDGTLEPGQPWTRYAFKDTRGLSFSTFDTTIGGDVSQNLPGPWNVQWEDKPGTFQGQPITYHNIVQIGPAGEPPPPAHEGHTSASVPTSEGVSSPPVQPPTYIGAIEAEARKTRSVSLSYAKDLVVAKALKLDDILAYAAIFDAYISGQDKQIETPIPPGADELPGSHIPF